MKISDSLKGIYSIVFENIEEEYTITGLLNKKFDIEIYTQSDNDNFEIQLIGNKTKLINKELQTEFTPPSTSLFFTENTQKIITFSFENSVTFKLKTLPSSGEPVYLTYRLL